MKKILILFTMLLLVSQLVTAADVITTDISKIPVAARELLMKYFPRAKVANIKIDKDALQSPSYDVLLDDGTKIEFDSKGQVTEIDCKHSSVPSSIVPASVTSYVNSNFKDNKIVKIEWDRKGNEVKLSNGMELKFDSKGKFIKMDH